MTSFQARDRSRLRAPDLPARLAHARQLTGQGQFAQGNAGDTEFLIVGFRPAGDRAAAVEPGRARVAGELCESLLHRELVVDRNFGVVELFAKLRASLGILRDQRLASIVSVHLGLLRHARSVGPSSRDGDDCRAREITPERRLAPALGLGEIKFPTGQSLGERGLCRALVYGSRSGEPGGLGGPTRLSSMSFGRRNSR